MRVCMNDLALNNPKWLICHKTKPNLNQSAEAVEYADCISTGGPTLPSTGVLNMTLNHQVIMNNS